MKKFIVVQLKTIEKICCCLQPIDIKIGDYVIIEGDIGQQCVKVLKHMHEVVDEEKSKDLSAVLRIANIDDIQQMDRNKQDQDKAFYLAEKCIIKHNLDMKLVDVEYTLDRKRIIFYFTADGRVDFRDLVRDLASIFRTRIELRQIGVRDEAKRVGGLGICGQPLCCSRFLKNFSPVSIKMAKEQNLSLNPTKISGCCGRLMCCLSYEQPAYDYLKTITPGLGSVVSTPDGEGVVTEVNLISGSLRVKIDNPEDGEAPIIRYFNRSVCTYIKGGKYKPKSQVGVTDGEE